MTSKHVSQVRCGGLVVTKMAELFVTALHYNIRHCTVQTGTIHHNVNGYTMKDADERGIMLEGIK